MKLISRHTRRNRFEEFLMALMVNIGLWWRHHAAAAGKENQSRKWGRYSSLNFRRSRTTLGSGRFRHSQAKRRGPLS
jgi:hypothetical protein